MNPEEIAARYGPRITEWLLQWKDYLMAKGYSVDCLDGEYVYDVTDEEFGWGLGVTIPKDMCYPPHNDRDSGMEIRFVLAEEAAREGNGGKGMAPHVGFTGEGGLVIGTLCPHNYTKSLWVCEENALAQRMEEVFEASFDDILEAMNYYFEALLSDREEEYLKSISQGKLSGGK